MKVWLKAAALLMGVIPAAQANGADGGPPGWSGYPIIMWQDQTPARAAGLRRLGVTALRVFGTRGALSADVAAGQAAAVSAGLRFYVENIATDFYAAYHRYQPGQKVTAAFDAARALHARDPVGRAAFVRQPSLSDPHALDVVQARLAEHVRVYGPYHPLFYSLGDETGIADLAAAWDFDLSAPSLAAMRVWLRGRYGTLAALNSEWGTDFVAWNAVVPMTTDAAIHAADGNFAAWTEFKAWMDVAFADAVRAGTAAVHDAGPGALAAIEGAQIPGWGGYDYARLAGAVDVMEIYDAGQNVDIARSLNPNLVVLTTMAASADPTAERGRLWRALLQGNRGLIIWDDAGVLVDQAGAATALGVSYAGLFQAFTGGLAALLAAAKPPDAPAAILYSPASFRIDWLLARRQDGQDWAARSAETEGQDTPLRASMQQASALLTHVGLAPHWVSEAMLEQGELGGARVLLLPHATALSAEAVTAVGAFVAAGGTVLADAPPGLFDARGRRRGELPLAGVVAAAAWPDVAGFAERLAQAGVGAPLVLSGPAGVATDVAVRTLRNGATTIISLQRDQGAVGTEWVTLTLPAPSEVYDLRRHGPLGRLSRVALKVGPDEPVLLAAAPVALPRLVVSGPSKVRPGGDVTLAIGFGAASPAETQVLHVDVTDPASAAVPTLGGTVVVRGDHASWRLAIPGDARMGDWTVRVSDRLSGGMAVWRIRVGPSDLG